MQRQKRKHINSTTMMQLFEYKGVCDGGEDKEECLERGQGEVMDPEFKKGLIFCMSNFECHSDGKKQYLKGLKQKSDMSGFHFQKEYFECYRDNRLDGDTIKNDETRLDIAVAR